MNEWQNGTSSQTVSHTHLYPSTYLSPTSLALEPVGGLDQLVALKSPGVGLGWPLHSQAPGHLIEGGRDIKESPDHLGALACEHHVCLSFLFC